MSISASIPTYRQLNPKGFFSPCAQLIEEGEAFEFEGEPNADMEALNEPARKKLEAYFKKIDDGAREVAEKNGRSYTPGRVNLDVMVANATADARRVELRPGDGGIPLMQAQKDRSVRKVQLDDAPQVYRKNRKSTVFQEALV